MFATRTLNRRDWILASTSALLLGSATSLLAETSDVRADPALPNVHVFTMPHCSCCGMWADHLSANGFTVTTEEATNQAAIRAKYGVPESVSSGCHTSVMGSYVLEGHVPADQIKRMLRERATFKGLAVRGMPVGSPGMEGMGGKAVPYDVLAFDANGHVSVYASHVQPG